MSKMSAVLKLLLLATVTLLVSAQGWSNYWSLPDLLRTHVNKALDKANRNFGGPFHVAYHKTLPNPRPWIDCLVCKQVNGEQLVDCARQINVKNRGDIRNMCSPRKETGSSFNWKVSKTTEAAHTKLAKHKI